MVQNYIYFSILQNKSSFIFRKGMRVEFFLYLLFKKNNALPSYAMVHLMYKFSKATNGKIHF